MKSQHYASGEIPQVGDIVRFVGDTRVVKPSEVVFVSANGLTIQIRNYRGVISGHHHRVADFVLIRRAACAMRQRSLST